MTASQVYYHPQSSPEMRTLVRPTPGQVFDERLDLQELLKQSLKERPTMLSTGHVVTELHPPARVSISRTTKVRKIPHHAGEIIKRLPAGTPVVAIAATPDLMWLQIGEHQFIPTRDCKFEFSDEQRSAAVFPIEPPLNVHVAVNKKVIVRKIPNDKGKPVGYLAKGDMVRAIGVTRDYSFVQIGHKQFVPTTALKVGDPLIPLDPPLTVHIARKTPVLDMPSNNATSVQGNVVSTLSKDDVVEAIATTTDYQWMKLASGSYIRTDATRMGLPHPAATLFPQALLIKIHEPAPVIKNPRHPELVLRTLRKGDQLQAFGVTNDFRYLVLAHHRYIPLLSARLVSPISKPISIKPSIPIKLNKDEIIRHIPDPHGRVMSRAKKGEELQVIGVNPEFSWLQLGDRQWIPLTSASIRRIIAPLRELNPAIQVTIKEDVQIRRRPDYTAKKRKTIMAGSVVTAVAATPDAEWLKLSEKEYIPADSAILIPVPSVAPLTPPINVVIVSDAKVYQSPNVRSVVVKRLARGEIVKAVGTTTDLRWIKLSDNNFLLTSFASNIPSMIPLVPSIRFTVATLVKERNIPAFSGMAIRTIQKGETVIATETSPDYKWVKVGHQRYLPTSALLLDEDKDVDMIILMKQRSGKNALKAESGKLTTKSLHIRKPKVAVTSTTPLAAEQLNRNIHEIEGETALEFEGIRRPTPVEVPSQGRMQRFNSVDQAPIKQLRIVSDAAVMNAPRTDATQIRSIRKGTKITAYAVDKDMNWLQIGPSEYIKLDSTDVAKQVRKHQL